MAFDLDKLQRFCMAEMQRFAEDHQDEVFYAFAIDASLLCLNSEGQFAVTLQECQDEWDQKTRPIQRWEDLTDADVRDSDFLLGLHEKHSGLDRSDKEACLQVINKSRSQDREKGSPYCDPEEIRMLRENTGDWAYQGFADMRGSDGFDYDAYSEHYDMSDEEQKTSAYGTAMDKLIEHLRMSNAFECLNTAPTFYARRVEHNY